MHQPEAYVIQTDPFFAQLKAWGNTIWDLWWHNKDIPGAAPFLMTQATLGVGGCTAPVPTLNLATPGNQEVTLEWSNEHSADSSVVGYKIYYDQAGKAQLIADVGLITTYADTGLTNGQEYCYKVTSSYADCESDFSNIECATPQNQGQTTDPAGVVAMETGYYSGKGKNKTWNVSNTFAPGDTVVIRAIVYDITNNVPRISWWAAPRRRPSPAGRVTPTASPKPPGRPRSPTRRVRVAPPPGTYTASTTDVTASGYHWDSVTTDTTFTIQ